MTSQDHSEQCRRLQLDETQCAKTDTFVLISPIDISNHATGETVCHLLLKPPSLNFEKKEKTNPKLKCQSTKALFD